MKVLAMGNVKNQKIKTYNMKSILLIILLSFFVNLVAQADFHPVPTKPWYKKLGNNPVSKYMKKREECKRYADMADTVHLGKIRYKNCMEDN